MGCVPGRRDKGGGPRRFAWSCSGAALLVLCWQAASGAGPLEPDSARVLALGVSSGSARPAGLPRQEEARVFASARVSTPPAPPPGGDGARGEAPEAPLFSPAPGPSAPLPLSSDEPAPDGLPVTGMRCTREGQGFSCGSCRTDGDCSTGQGCVANRDTRRFECQASECEADAHCFPGTVCRAVTTGATGTRVHRCVLEGVRSLGEACDALPVSPLGSCREGLRCVEQVCTAPCTPGAPGACAEGYVCTEGLEGSGCFPDCRQRGCAEGERCTQVREQDFQCLVDTRGDCRDTPCGEGERCNLRMSRGRAALWCARLCNPVLPDTCGAGEVCGMGSATQSTCFRQCDPLDPRACAPGWSCSTVTEDMSVFGCTPDLPR